MMSHVMRDPKTRMVMMMIVTAGPIERGNDYTIRCRRRRVRICLVKWALHTTVMPHLKRSKERMDWWT